MQYNEALNWVNSLPRLAGSPGIENTKLLLNALGNPEKKLNFVHIAGTNGKGSTAVMLSNILQNAGYKTGTTISPYVIDFRERFLCNNKMITKSECAKMLTIVKNAADNLEHYVAFDIVTATAILWFEKQKCDIVCLETGLGGKLDSSNAIQNTLVACIMAIGKDHTELLGDTLAEIAKEKCGIIKNNCKIVCYPKQETEAFDVIKKYAEEKKCEFILPDLKKLSINFDDDCNTNNKNKRHIIKKETIYLNENKIKIPLAGEHQAYNASVAIYAAIALRSAKTPFKINDENIINGIQKSRFAARIEVLQKEPLIILDGAHNLDGAKALAKTLNKSDCNNFIGIIGVLKRNDIDEIAKVLSPYLKEVYTVTPNSPRALNAKDLAEHFMKYAENVKVFDDTQEAIKTAVSENKNILICGSLYLASEARKKLNL